LLRNEENPSKGFSMAELRSGSLCQFLSTSQALANPALVKERLRKKRVQSNNGDQQTTDNHACALGSHLGACPYRLRVLLQRQSRKGLDSINSVCWRNHCLALALAFPTTKSSSRLTRCQTVSPCTRRVPHSCESDDISQIVDEAHVRCAHLVPVIRAPLTWLTSMTVGRH
jgi:hypothetical protein